MMWAKYLPVIELMEYQKDNEMGWQNDDRSNKDEAHLTSGGNGCNYSVGFV